MKYIEFVGSLDILHRADPKYYSHELLLLAEDVLRWINEEFAQDNSALVYLKSLYHSPSEAVDDLWNKIQLLVAPFMELN